MQRVAMTPRAAATQRFVRAYSSKGKDIRFGTDARSKMLKGVTRLTQAVSATLGPKGRNVIIQQPFGPAKITKDGVTVAKAVEFKEPFENLGAQLVRQVANTTNEIAGDGTTTSTVLAQAIFAEGFKHVTQGRSPIEMKRGIDRAVKEVVQALNAQKRDVSTPEEMRQVATISANGDLVIGNLISSAMEKVGRDGVITTADGNKLEDELQTTEGMSLDRGFISPYFVTDTKTQKTELKDANLLICKQKISDLRMVLQVLEATQLAPLLIVAEDVEGEALQALILNKLQGRVRVCAVKAPGFGDNRTNILNDLAIFSGGTVVDEEAGVKVTNAREALAVLGKVKKVSVSKDQTILLEGAGKPEDIKARVQSIREACEVSSSDWDREKMQERMAKLQGGVAVIRVGGASDVEVGEKKDRVTDALNATRCAIQEGIVAGGGTALLYAGRSLLPLLQDPNISDDQKLGIRIIFEAVKLPLKTIAENAGIDGGVVVHRVLREKSATFGYDASKDEYVDMFQAGIVDPVKVVRAALVDASSVASLIMTTEAAIVDAVDEDKKDKDE